MNISNLIIGIVVVSMAAAGMFTVVTELGAGNGFTPPEHINTTYNQLAEVESNTANLTNVFQTSSLAEAIGFFPSGVINVIMLVPRMLHTTTLMLAQFIIDLELPNYVLIGLGIILTVLVVMAIVSVLARWPV